MKCGRVVRNIKRQRAISIHKYNVPINKDGWEGVGQSGRCYYPDQTSYYIQPTEFSFEEKLALSVFCCSVTVWLKVSTSSTSQLVSKDGHYCPLDLWLRSKKITFPLSFLQASVPLRLITLYFRWRDGFAFCRGLGAIGVPEKYKSCGAIVDWTVHVAKEGSPGLTSAETRYKGEAITSAYPIMKSH